MKKGFTLIELLAVMVVLAIILLIAIPIIANVVEDAQDEGNKRSIELYASAIKNGIATYQLNKGTMPSNIQELKQENFIEYDGTEVICKTEKLNSDGSIYLAGCTVGDTEVLDYEYGKEKVCTRQNDEEGFDIVICTIEENTESFYVMNSYLTDVSSDKIVMLTKYNIDPTTYRQSSTAGVSKFSSTYYWESTGDNSLVYVYDEKNDGAKITVDEYVTYLNTKLTGVTGSLLTYDQLEALGCSLGTWDSAGSCINAPKWLYSTSRYWTGMSKGASSTVLTIEPGDSSNNFNGLNSFMGIVELDSNGIRPVITISTSDIQ